MITVCIPAFEAGAFLGETLTSVLQQTYDNFRVAIAVDPSDDPDDGTLAAIAPFRDDPRISVRVNPTRLGWAENFNALLGAVETDFYVPLPHDDCWDHRYLETLAPLVMSNPSASVAYADMSLFGASKPGEKKAVPLPAGESRALHLLRFMIAGAHAVPWRGVTRRNALKTTGGFPRDGLGGFAVEAEYALGLLEAGRALHVPLPIYHKRVFTDEQRVSASRARLRRGQSDLDLAWRRHRANMQERLNRILRCIPSAPAEATLIKDAFQAAMFQRRQAMVAPGLSPAEVRYLQKAIRRTWANTHPLSEMVATRLQGVLTDDHYEDPLRSPWLRLKRSFSAAP